jgi:hypothetical protein
LVYILVLVLVFHLCPSSVRVISTFYFFYYVLCSRFFLHTLILYFS